LFYDIRIDHYRIDLFSLLPTILPTLTREFGGEKQLNTLLSPKKAIAWRGAELLVLR
jgi:hypothetical protein